MGESSQGNIPDGQPDFGKAVKIGSVARTALPVAAPAGTRIPILIDEFGRLVVSAGPGGIVDVNIISPLPVPVDATIVSPLPVPVDATIVSPLPVPVDATIVSPLPVPVDATIVSPLPIPVTGAVPTASGTDAYNFTYQTAASATNVVKATPGRIYQCYVFNPSGGVRTFQLHNLAAAPGGGAVPAITPVELPDDTALFFDFGPNGIFFSTGIVMASSSAVATFTSSAGLHMTAVWF